MHDATGALLPGVTVTITNVETGAKRTVQSGSDGSYRAPLLPLGSYAVKAEISGFKTLERTGISLAAARRPWSSCRSTSRCRARTTRPR